MARSGRKYTAWRAAAATRQKWMFSEEAHAADYGNESNILVNDFLGVKDGRGEPGQAVARRVRRWRNRKPRRRLKPARVTSARRLGLRSA